MARARAKQPAVVHVTTRGGPHAGLSTATVKRRTEKMTRALGLTDVEISVAIVGDDEIHELNKSWRHKDKPTDVLSFPMQELAPGDRPAAGLLGDIIVSAPTAQRQADANDRPLLDEATMLLAHGLLHLLGYDHQNDRDEAAMNARTRDLEAAARSRG